MKDKELSEKLRYKIIRKQRLHRKKIEASKIMTVLE